jgi:hypothetical protein
MLPDAAKIGHGPGDPDVTGETPSDCEYEIRDVGEGRVEDLCSLFKTVFQTDISPSSWRWKYQDPALDGHVNVVLAQGDRILGHAGALILPGVLDGEPVPLAQVCDVMLSPDLRGGAGPHGPYATFMKGLIGTLQARIPEGMFFGFPGARPFRLGERLGFYRGTGLIHEYLRPTVPWGTGFWRLSPLDWDDARVDDLWSRHEARSGCRLVRDRRYLGWRYRRHPDRTYHLHGVRRGLSLIGWVVLHRHEDEIRVIDRLIDESALAPILGAVGGRAHADGAGRLVWWQGDLSERAPTGATARSTGMVGVVMPSSAPRFAHCNPSWQPGDTDVC